MYRLAVTSAVRPLRLLVGLPVLRLSGRLDSRESGKRVGRMAFLSDDLSACKGNGIFPSLYRFSRWWQLVAASGREWLHSRMLPRSLSPSDQPICLSVCLSPGCPTGWPSGNPAGGSVRRFAHRTASRSADLPACKVKGIFPYPYRFRFWWQLVAASGREWLRSPHVFNGLNALPLHPGSVLLLGSKKVSGDRCLAVSVTTGLSPIRSPRIFVSSKTQQGMFRVTRNLAGYSRKPCP